MGARNNFGGFQLGLSCAYTPTSSYVTFAKVPGNGSDLLFDIIQASTANRTDIRFVRSIASEASQFLLTSTSYADITCSFQGNTTKHAHTFAIQAQQSTASTTFSGTIQIRFVLRWTIGT